MSLDRIEAREARRLQDAPALTDAEFIDWLEQRRLEGRLYLTLGPGPSGKPALVTLDGDAPRAVATLLRLARLGSELRAEARAHPGRELDRAISNADARLRRAG